MIDTPTLIKRLYVLNPDAVLLDDMDSAIVCLANIGVFGPVPVYSKQKIYDKMAAAGLSKDDIVECYQSKCVGLWAGEHTPVILEDAAGETK